MSENDILTSLVGGAAGAGFTLLFTVGSNQYAKAKELNLIRTTIIGYLETCVKILDHAKSDYELAEARALKKETTESKKRGFRGLDMLSAEAITCFSSIDLRKTCLSYETYKNLIYLRHSLDHIRLHSPKDVYVRHYAQVERLGKNVLQLLDGNQGKEEVDAINESFLTAIREQDQITTEEVKLRIESCSLSQAKAKYVLRDLQGGDANWILRYLGPEI